MHHVWRSHRLVGVPKINEDNRISPVIVEIQSDEWVHTGYSKIKPFMYAAGMDILFSTKDEL